MVQKLAGQLDMPLMQRAVFHRVQQAITNGHWLKRIARLIGCRWLGDTLHLCIRQGIKHRMNISYPALIARNQFCQGASGVKLCRTVPRNRSSSGQRQHPELARPGKMGSKRKKRVGFRERKRLIEQRFWHSAKLLKNIAPNIFQ